MTADIKEIHRRGLLFVLSSPSGAGKSTLSRRLLQSDDNFRLSISATTRAPRPGEVEGEHYFFVSRDEFEGMVAEGEMLEHAEVFGNLYGTPRMPVENWISKERDVLFDVDWQGARQLGRSSMRADLVRVFVLPPSVSELHRRLVARAQDSTETVDGRMSKSQAEYSHWGEYDYVLINDNIDACQKKIETIIEAERLRSARQIGLSGFVAGLDKEYEEMFG